MISDPNTHIHDRFARKMLSDPRRAREFLAIHLPENIKSTIDFDHLELQPRSHVNEVRKESIVDVLYKTTLHYKTLYHKEAYLYLMIEHQSTPDKLMPFRILKYTCNVIQEHLDKTNAKKLPLIYPIVLYHGKKAYSHSNDIRDIVNAPRELIDQYFLKPFQLIDLSQIQDRVLKKHSKIGIMEYVLKHINDGDMLPPMREIAGDMQQVAKAGDAEYIYSVLQYALEGGDLKENQEFFELINEQISSEVGEKIMTLAERLRDEGRAQGIEKGMAQGIAQGQKEGELSLVKRILTNCKDLSHIAELTELSIEQLQIIKEEI